MAQVRRTLKARRDSLEIWRFIAADDERAADKLIREIDSRAFVYARNPNIGQKRPLLGEDVRSFPVGRYLIFYRPIPDGILILRILHSARDVVNVFEA